MLTFSGGQPLPWSAMVLARTAFEGSIRVINLLEPLIDDDLRLARFAANILEDLNETAKTNDELPPDLAQPSIESVANYRQRLEALCDELNLVYSGNRRGQVTTAMGERAAFPLNLSDAAKQWWSPHGVYAYRWLSSFTHGSPRTGDAADVPVTALRAEDVYATFATITEAVWHAMDAYARWLGFPDDLVMALMRRAKKSCEAYFPQGLPVRTLSDAEQYFFSAADALRELGVPDRVIRRFLRGFTRTIDH